MSKKRKKKKQRVWGAKFRDASGKVGVVLPSTMTLEDCVRLGMTPRMVPKNAPREPGTLVFDPEKDMPPGV